MKRYHYETTTTLPAEALYAAMSDVTRWPEWDAGLASVTSDGPATRGAAFVLTPKGGPRVTLHVTEAEPGRVFTDIARLPLGRMQTEHRYTALGDLTRVELIITVSGPLGFLWDRLIARPQAREAAAQTRAFLAFAERYA